MSDESPAEVHAQIEWLRADGRYTQQTLQELMVCYAELHRKVAADTASTRMLDRLRRWLRPKAAARRDVISPWPLTASKPVLIPLTAHPQRVMVNAPDGGEVWATLGAVSQALACSISCRPAAEEAHTYRLLAGVPQRLLGADCCVADQVFDVVRLRGDLGVLKLELRSAPDAPMVGAGDAHAHTLWRAQEMVADGRTDDVLRFARATATRIERPAVHLLQANLNPGDEATWIEHLNAYLAAHGVAGVQLTAGGTTRFGRLETAALPKVDGGPLISVIMPAYNAAPTLRAAAQSVLNQTWTAVELIVIDDCSADDTWTIAQQLAREDARVKLLRNRLNVGPYVSKNLALAVAQGVYITGHDADDWAHPQRLQQQMQRMADGAVQGQIATMGGMLRMSADGLFSSLTKQGMTSVDGALRDAPISCLFDAAFLRRELGHFDSVRFGADGELIERMARIAGARFDRSHQLLMICLDAAGNLTRDPTHGNSPLTGISPTRRAYRDQWRTWHRQIAKPEDAYLPFPLQARMFDVPKGLAVPYADVQALVDSHKLDG